MRRLAAALHKTFTRRRSADPAALRRLLARQAAFVAQKTATAYCEVKIGLDWHKALSEPAFRDALADCRWRVYLDVLGDITANLEAWLRRQVPGREAALAAALAAIHNGVLADQPPPDNLAAERAAAESGIEARLLRLQLGPPHPPHELPLASEPTILATLPIHPRLRRDDGPAIIGGLRFYLVSAHQEMARAFDPGPLATALLASQPETRPAEATA